jgi:hypothetical protein
VDDGGTAFGGDDTSAPQTFTITVTDVNDPPTFTPGGSQTIIRGGGPDGQLQRDQRQPRALQRPAAVAPNGTLTYTPAFLALGSATVTFTPVDDGGTANGGSATGTPRSITITIIVG